MQNFKPLRQTLLGDLVEGWREEEEKIMPSLMATTLRWRTHSARTNYVSAIQIIQPNILVRCCSGISWPYCTTMSHNTWHHHKHSTSMVSTLSSFQ